MQTAGALSLVKVSQLKKMATRGEGRHTHATHTRGGGHFRGEKWAAEKLHIEKALRAD
jgi:hypothetical protein